VTRINCIPVEELTDKHLGAEYRELPRVFALVRDAAAKGKRPWDFPILHYTLGTGHVQFFYTRLSYLIDRYAELVAECRKRGRVVNFPDLPTHGLPDEWFGSWTPDETAQAVNRARIAQRLNDTTVSE